MRKYEVIIHVTAPDDLKPDDYLGLRFLSKDGVTFTRESITEIESDIKLMCPACRKSDVINAGGNQWLCNCCDAQFTTDQSPTINPNINTDID